MQKAHPQTSRTREPRAPSRPGSRRVGVFAGLIGLLCAATVSADDIRIGYVDWKRLLDTAPQVIAAREAMDREFRPRNESLLADEARLERMREELAEAGEIDSEQRFEMEREIRNLQRSIERRREDLGEELRFRTNAEKKALEETIEVAVRQVAESGNYDLILINPVAYASDAIDITDRILEWLEADFRGQNGEEDAP